MKHLHKFASVLLALVMALSLMVPAFATSVGEEQPVITLPANGHTYEIYQIFTGRLDTVTEGEGENAVTKDILSDIKWGANGVNGNATVTVGAAVESVVLDELKAVVANDNNKEKLKVIEKYVDMGKDTTPFATKESTEGNNTVSVAPGYYLIKDTAKEEESTTADGLYVVEMVGNVTVAPKTSNVPTPDKEVQEDSNGTWQNHGDFEVGQEIPYKLTATLPSNMTDVYESYVLNFVDTMDGSLDLVMKGTTASVTDLTITVQTKDGDDVTLPDRQPSVTYETNAEGKHVLRVNFSNVITVGNEGKITIEYKAKLNSDAVVGNSGNKNEMHLEFARDPQWKPDGDKNPPDTTPDIPAVVFTFNLKNTKVSGGENKQNLSDAEFRLARKDKDDNYEWATIDEGKISGWTKAIDDDPVIKADSVDVHYAGSVVKSDKDGKFSFTGLDAEDTYYLFETKAPAGYNILTKPLTVKITATYAEDGKTITALTAVVGDASDITGTPDNGTVGTEIENNAGATLPETGGIGTTIFYVVGGLLTVGAVVLLVTKKRMSVDSDK